MGHQFPRELGDRIHELRRLVDLSQADLAAELGRATNDAISRLETAKAGSISLRVLAGLIALAERAGRSAQWLLTGQEPPAATAGSPFGQETVDRIGEIVRQHMEAGLWRGLGISQAEFDDLIARARRLTAHAPAAPAPPATPAAKAAPPPPAQYQVTKLVEPGFQIVDVAELPKRWRGEYVPVIGRLAAGEGVDTVEAEEHPPGWADTYIRFDGAPPGAFAVRVVGDSMAPEYASRDMVVVDPDQPVTGGVCCVIYTHRGDRLARLKILRVARRWAYLESIAPGHPPVKVEAGHVQAYKVIAHLPAVRRRSTPGD